MARHDPPPYADLAQGRIRHIVFHLEADSAQRQLRGTARYMLDQPARRPFDLDTRDLDVRSVSSSGRAVRFTFGKEDPILGSRLRLRDLAGADEFTITFVASQAARALQWLSPAQTAGGRPPYLFSL